ncbi:MAG: hypothetical protein US74_C0027G0007 [Parcubacteria group bacterium GW2011_GWA2_38_13]|nr:MAG: hypothetical protein US74_C0027G0007 [Parcubacteria group bacterium GW2011_GWA2_38_13]
MERKNKILITLVIIAAILFVAIAVIAPRVKTPGNANAVNSPANSENANFSNINLSANIAIPNSTPVIVTEKPSTQSTLEAIARTFAEKFGSFSTMGNFENIYDVEFFMTADMKEWAKKYIVDNAVEPGAEFYGVTTRALKTEIVVMDDDETQAQIVVTTQREETRGSITGRSNIIYQKIAIDFLKIENEWKVNAANWR